MSGTGSNGELESLDASELIGKADVLLMTFDTLRWDVACAGIEQNRTPFLQSILPDGQWEQRHTPGSFTWAAHQSFFSGFLPTPTTPGPHPRLFAARFPGSETTTSCTWVFDAPEVVTGLRDIGYHTICIGGVGFFNQQSPLGSVMPSLFDEAHWDRSLGVTDPESTANQVRLAVDRVSKVAANQRLFLFVNLSAMHQPNCFYIDGETTDSPQTQLAALAYVDSQLPPLFDALSARGETLCVLCADHGTAYGEDGHTGHRLAHPTVWNVPYAEFVVGPTSRTEGASL